MIANPATELVPAMDEKLDDKLQSDECARYLKALADKEHRVYLQKK